MQVKPKTSRHDAATAQTHLRQHVALTPPAVHLWAVAVPELETLPEQQQVAFTLIQALDALRDGLRPFVVGVLQEKEGPHWFDHPRVQRMVPAPPALEGEAPYGTEGPVLDLALLLKLIGSDCNWYRTFRPRLPGISRWQVDSLRELRNRVAHNDGAHPLLTTPALGIAPRQSPWSTAHFIVGGQGSAAPTAFWSIPLQASGSDHQLASTRSAGRPSPGR